MPHVATKVEVGFKSSLSTHRPMARESARSPREHALAEEDEGTAAPARREDCRGILPARRLALCPGVGLSFSGEGEVEERSLHMPQGVGDHRLSARNFEFDWKVAS